MLPNLSERTRAVAAWAEQHHRDLPWRATRDPWAVLVSEFMLQQTQVVRVIPKYVAFLERHPTPEACASVPAGEVVTSWAGLGYNRRAISLHRCAQVISERHAGRVPDELDALLALPGIGPYTARAVLVFAFERDVGVVDTNVARVLARWEGRTLTLRQAQHVADAAVPAGHAWSWNQGMLDLGAMVCTKRSPSCERCPTADACAWFARGLTAPDPAVGSAGVSGGQSRFAGSDRQGRGRLVDVLRVAGSVSRPQIASAAGWPDDEPRAVRVAQTLVVDGLAAWCDDGALTFPR